MTLTKSLARAIEENSLLKQLHQSDVKALKDASASHTKTPVTKWIQGKGNGVAVPVYLRWKGKIRYRPISKHQLESLLTRIWDEKEKRNPKLEPLSMEEHLHQFLTTRFGAVGWLHC